MSEITAVPIRPIKRAWVVWLSASVALAGIAGVGLAWAGTAKTVAIKGTAEQFMAWHKGVSGVVTTPSGLQYQVMKKGAGPTPTDTDVTLINYVGALRDGKVFDKGQRTPLPVNGVVPGFQETLKLMPKGATYRVWIPPALGYGDVPQGDAIPAHSVLQFDIDMIDFRSQAEVQAQMQAMQAQRGQAEGGMPPPEGPAPQQ